jgi:hypothetical protein
MYGQSVKQICFFLFFSLFVYLLGVCVLHGQADSFAQWLDNKREKNKNLLLIQGAATNLQQLFMVCTTPSCISPKKCFIFSESKLLLPSVHVESFSFSSFTINNRFEIVAANKYLKSFNRTNFIH